MKGAQPKAGTRFWVVQAPYHLREDLTVRIDSTPLARRIWDLRNLVNF